MKLPVYQQTPTPRLASVSPSAYGAEGRAWGEAFKDIGVSVSNAVKLKNEYDRKESVRLGIEAEDRVEQIMTGFDGEHSGKTEYTNMDIPENIRSQRKIPDEGVSPAYQSYAPWRKSVHDKAVAEEAKSITDPRVRRDWLLTQQRVSTKRYHDDIIQQGKQQVTYMNKALIGSIEQDRVAGNYAGAQRKVQHFQGTEQDRMDLQNKIESWKQTDYLDTKLYPAQGQTSEEYLESLSNTQALLMTNDPNTIGQIPDKRDTYLSKYTAKIASVLTKMNNGSQGEKRLAIAKTNTIIDNLKNMQNQSAETITSSITDMHNIGHPEKAQELQRQYDIMLTTKALLAAGPPADIVNLGLKDFSESLTPEQGALNVAVYKNATEALTVFNTDTMQYMQTYEVINIEPIDTDNPKNFALSMNKRLSVMATGLEVLGKAPDPLSKQEAMDLDSFLSELNVSQTMAYLSELHGADGMGEKAVLVWDQMQQYGYSPVTSIAGQYAAEGNTAVSRMVLEGNEWVKTDKNRDTLFQDTVKQDLKNIMVADLYGALATADQKAAAEDAVVAVAGYYASRGLELTDQRLQQAVDLGSGGTVDFNGYKVVSPEVGMKDNTFGSWIKNLSPRNFDNTQVEYSPEFISKSLDSGKIALRPTGKRGNWFLQDTDSGYNIKDVEGKLAFILSYDKYARTIGHDKIQAKAETGPAKRDDYYLGQ